MSWRGTLIEFRWKMLNGKLTFSFRSTFRKLFPCTVLQKIQIIIIICGTTMKRRGLFSSFTLLRIVHEYTFVMIINTRTKNETKFGLPRSIIKVGAKNSEILGEPTFDLLTTIDVSHLGLCVACFGCRKEWQGSGCIRVRENSDNKARK